MNCALLLPNLLGALTTSPSAPLPSATPAPPEIRDIAPPIDVFPYPPWVVAVAIGLAVVILALLVWFIVSLLRHRPGTPPPTPTAVALAELEKLRARANEIEPYQFSFAVSDVLRTFIGNAKFRLPATRQTSPEFLAAISSSQLFSEEDRSLLGHFLEKCDMIKFARIHATSTDNSELVGSALAFVQGGKP